jgi:hypothetical protein
MVNHSAIHTYIHTLVAGTYSGDCNANGSGTIEANEHQTCTITNTEQDNEMKNY